MVLLLAQEDKAFGQQEFLGLISGLGFRKLSSVVLPAWENKACRQREFWSPSSYIGFRELSSVVILLPMKLWKLLDLLT
jgi:hypothetical protein